LFVDLNLDYNLVYSNSLLNPIIIGLRFRYTFFAKYINKFSVVLAATPTCSLPFLPMIANELAKRVRNILKLVCFCENKITTTEVGEKRECW